jgi:hypothetical protein
VATRSAIASCRLGRRTFLGAAMAVACDRGRSGHPSPVALAVGSDPSPMLSRPIPSTGELLPVIGMGTWQTFDADEAAAATPARRCS